MNRAILEIDGQSLSLEAVSFFLTENPSVILTGEAKRRVNRARELVDGWVESYEVIYGVTTGFGEFANVSIPKDDIERLQENLILSHSCGVGEFLPEEIIRLMMLLRANALSRGYSGIRLSSLDSFLRLLNEGIIPAVPSQGSVGSSGDLVPLAHLVLPLIGRGYVFSEDEELGKKIQGRRVRPSLEVLKEHGIEPVVLKAKEGLALINGTQMMTAFAVLICIRALRLIKLSDIAGAMSNEALRATDRAYDRRLHALRPYPGQMKTAENLLRLIEGSQIRQSHKANDPRVQDSYSIRCIPQIHGASRDAIDYVTSRVEIEMNSVNDNPLIFPEDGDHIEGGNFHGQPLALAMDFMGIALSELADVSERRVERLVNGSLSALPRFLTEQGGLNSGLMIAQYSCASLVSENKVLAHPASVDSIPTSANQEDHNSMGSIAARKCFGILKNAEAVISIELMTASQGVEFLRPLKCGRGTEAAYEFIRKHIAPLKEDRLLYDDISRATELVRSGELLRAVEDAIGPL